MKTLVLCAFVMTTICVSVFAQSQKIHPETPEVRETFQKMLVGIETEKDPYDLSGRLWNLEKKYLEYWNHGMRYQAQTTREMTMRLITVFNRLDESPINRANQVSIIEIIGIADNSQEAHEFFLKILENGSERNRERALLRIWPVGVRGDDIYDKVKSLVQRKKLKRIDSLSPLKRANPERAINEMVDYLRTAEDVGEFKGVGQLLSDYDRPELMEIIIDRYPEMKKKWNGYYGDDPARAIKTKLLLRIAELKEGPRLQTVLEMLNQDGTSGEETLPIMTKKLGSNDKISREAALDFLRGQVQQGNLKAFQVKPLIKNAVGRERNKAVKTKGEALLRELR